MAVPEPYDVHGLWARVKPLSGWPDTNEDTVNSLAVAWRDASPALTPAVKVEPDDIRHAWRDGPGGLYATRVGDNAKRTEIAQLSCRQLHNHASEFARIVRQTKEDISKYVGTCADVYATVPERARDDFVGRVAKHVNKYLADGAGAVAALDSGVTAQRPSTEPFAEYDEIVRFILDEMVRNSNSTEVQRIRDAIERGAGLKTITGLYDWYNLVKTGGPYDHKGPIGDIITGDNWFTPIPGVPAEIRHDVWSNIHYGYVGRQAGIDDYILHTGANLADIKENGRTQPGDQAAIQIGIDLADRYGPGELTTARVTEAIMRDYDRLVATGMIRPL